MPFIGPKNKKIDLSQAYFIFQNNLDARQIFQKSVK